MLKQAAANRGRSLSLGVLLVHLTSHLEGEGLHASLGRAEGGTRSRHWFKWQVVSEAESSFPAESLFPISCPMVVVCPALWSKEFLII